MAAIFGDEQQCSPLTVDAGGIDQSASTARPSRPTASAAVAPMAKAQHPRRIHIAGDSTASQKYAAAAPETGWGMGLPWYLAPGIEVVNHAMNGRSSRSFVTEGRLDAIRDVIRPDDVLLVQFGHNDQKPEPVGTEPWTTYRSHLLLYLDVAREHGAEPVLLTPASRRRFDDDGNAVGTHGLYPDAMRALAAAEGVRLVDITAQTISLWQELGEEASLLSFLPERQDNTHFSPAGAGQVARLVARGLLATGVLAEHEVGRLDENVPVEWFAWPEVANLAAGQKRR